MGWGGVGGVSMGSYGILTWFLIQVETIVRVI